MAGRTSSFSSPPMNCTLIPIFLLLTLLKSKLIGYTYKKFLKGKRGGRQEGRKGEEGKGGEGGEGRKKVGYTGKYLEITLYEFAIKFYVLEHEIHVNYYTCTLYNKKAICCWYSMWYIRVSLH